MSTAVIGLGSMGFGMACSCVNAGLKTYGFDINEHSLAAFEAKGGLRGDVAALTVLDSVAIVVVNAAQTEAVLFGDKGIAPSLKKGCVVLGCATIPPDIAKSIETRLNALELQYLDAPISGGSVKAANGLLSVMASGSADAFNAAQTMLDAVAANVFHLGDSAGAGSAMKSVNQLLAGVHIAAMAEAITFGLSQGLSVEQMVATIPQCAGNSWMFENRAPHIEAGDYTPHSAVDIWPKDLGIVQTIAAEAKVQTPLTDAAFTQFSAASKIGLGREDDAAVVKWYAQQSGVTIPEKQS